MRTWCSILALSALSGQLLFGQPTAQTARDGKLFDPGITMTDRSEGAPAQLDRLLPYLGAWSVEITTSTSDSTFITRQGEAAITLMNRGHGFMERFRCADFNGSGEELNTINLLVYNNTLDLWGLGIADSYTESISLYHGNMYDGKLVLRTSVRRRGGLTLTHYLAELEFLSPDSMQFTLSASTDDAKTFKTRTVKRYTRIQNNSAILITRMDFGEAAPGGPAEAREFDFLLGEFTAQQEITFPNGQVAKFPSNTTAVHALNGNAIMEFNWYDVDPRLPDAATTIIRIYNRTIRRWESLYTTNRFNGLLFFGGKREGEKIVLTGFETHNGDPSFSHYVFHDIREDGYRWYSEVSRDRGKSFQKTWLINVERKVNGD